MGIEQYYRVLGQAVDDESFAKELKRARTDEDLKRVVRNRTQETVQLDDEDVRYIREAVQILPESSEGGPGRKYRT